MIYLDGTLIENKRFPDNTSALKLESYNGDPRITWLYDNDEEMFMIYTITKHLQNKGCRVRLYMPYIPNARMDRVKNEEDVFTLKYFCEFINSLNFFSVDVLDPHSNVSTGILNKVHIRDIEGYVWSALSNITYDVTGDCAHEDRETAMKNLVLFYPDEGSVKRYSEIYQHEYAFGIKHRDWKTGKITSLEIVRECSLVGKDILIIDDICSKGGTFMMAAQELKRLGARNIYLYVTHCENNIFNGEILNSDLLKYVYTTNSIYRGNHPKIKVVGELK